MKTLLISELSTLCLRALFLKAGHALLASISLFQLKLQCLILMYEAGFFCCVICESFVSVRDLSDMFAAV